MVESRYQQALDSLHEALKSEKFDKALDLADSLEVQLDQDKQAAPVARGWTIYFKLKTLFQAGQHHEGLSYFLANRDHLRTPTPLGLNLSGSKTASGKFVVISAVNLGWLHSVCSEMAVHSKQYDHIESLMRDALAIRIVSEDLESQFSAATSAIQMLEMAGRQKDNGTFAFFLLNFGCITATPGAAGRGILALVDNYLQTNNPPILKLIGIMMHRSIWHNGKDEFWAKEIATKISALKEKFDPTSLSDEAFHDTIVELGKAANAAFESGHGHASHAYYRAINELQIAHGKVYFPYFSRAIAGMSSSLVITDQLLLADAFWRKIADMGDQEFSEGALLSSALTSGALQQFEEHAFIHLIVRAYADLSVLESQPDKEERVDYWVDKVWSTDSYNEGIFPYLQMHYEHLYKKIHGGQITAEHQKKIAKAMGNHKVDANNYPNRLFPKINDWVVCESEPDAVFSQG
jgi:hypothetical protein